MVGNIPDLAESVLVVLEHVLILFLKDLQLLLAQLLLPPPLSSRLRPTVLLITIREHGRVQLLVGYVKPSTLEQHALALLFFPLQPYLHHARLDLPRLLELLLQIPRDTFTVRTERPLLGFNRFFFRALSRDCSSCRPSRKTPEAALRPFL